MATLPRKEHRRYRKPKRKPKRPTVTIAAGFKFDQGILFCADTKITTDIKTDESKISALRYPGGNCTTVFTFAGCVPYARMLVRRCEERITGLTSLHGVPLSMKTVEDNIEDCLVEFYQTHVYPHPDPDSVAPELLIGIWLKGETRLLTAVETTLNLVSDYECCGTGAYLARYWVRQFYNAHRHQQLQDLPSASQTALIANCALSSVMEYDESCGGRAEFQVLGIDGLTGPPEINHSLTRFPPRLLSAMWRMLGNLVDGAFIEPTINNFIREVRALTHEFDLLVDSSRSLAEKVSPSPSPSPSPSASPSASPSSGGEDADDV